MAKPADESTRAAEIKSLCPCMAYEVVWAGLDGKPEVHPFEMVALLELEDGDQRIVPLVPSENTPGDFCVVLDPSPRDFIRVKRRDESLTEADFKIAAMLNQDREDCPEHWCIVEDAESEIAEDDEF